MHSVDSIQNQMIDCPYCGEAIEVVIDCSIPEQAYIEDCQVCCRPINFFVAVDTDGDAVVQVKSENE